VRDLIIHSELLLLLILLYLILPLSLNVVARLNWIVDTVATLMPSVLLVKVVCIGNLFVILSNTFIRFFLMVPIQHTLDVLIV
jgi:hypothetical protein